MGKFHDNLKALRETHGMTQSDLAKRLGVAKSTISMYENGNREPNFEVLEAIADHFNVPMAQLLGDDNLYDDAQALTRDELILLNHYRALNPQGKRYIRQTLELALKSYGEAE